MFSCDLVLRSKSPWWRLFRKFCLHRVGINRTVNHVVSNMCKACCGVVRLMLPTYLNQCLTSPYPGFEAWGEAYICRGARFLFSLHVLNNFFCAQQHFLGPKQFVEVLPPNSPLVGWWLLLEVISTVKRAQRFLLRHSWINRGLKKAFC